MKLKNGMFQDNGNAYGGFPNGETRYTIDADGFEKLIAISRNGNFVWITASFKA